ncbi:hypothetical protein [Leifsonia sp. 22587]|uniref:hypothetical protein n=1 Tax=Leifsonia sp. 22587 TaxID=3453946 RepID=UPI003F863F15
MRGRTCDRPVSEEGMMTVTTSQPSASNEGYRSGQSAFERFVLDGERHFGPTGSRDRAFATFFEALAGDLRPAVEAYFRGAIPRTPLPLRNVVETEEYAPGAPVTTTAGAGALVREPGRLPVGRVGRVELLLEELTLDPCPTGRAGRRASVFLDITAVDAMGGLATTSTRICRRGACLPAAFCDRMLAAVELGVPDAAAPRTVSFEVAAAEGAEDRFPELVEATRDYVRRDLDTFPGLAREGAVLRPDTAEVVDAHVRAWLDCLLIWSADILPTTGKKAEARLGGEAQFTATLDGPELDYVYRNASTGRLVEIVGSSHVRGRPMVHTFSSADEELRARFRMGFRASTAAPVPVARSRPRVLQEVGT